jgi:alanyl-tRNA synthetase
MTSSGIRQKYLDFFEKKGHQVIPSAPLVPSDEQQLEGKDKVLFTTAGMQPLIPFLTGKKEPPSKRLVDCQKCLRTDDIDEVGDDTHHTFFEMLGNWSIGDYWKKEAIEMSYKFLTEELKIPKEKLAVSVFAGDSDAPKDEEAAKTWIDLGIPEDRIAYLGKEHNWWPTSRIDPTTGELKNAFGLCGPDTEMFYWVGDSDAPEKFDPEDSRWVEIWNDVFMQFNRLDDGTLEDLPQKNVDTGMGLERTVAVLNGKKSAYETDLFEPIISEIEAYCDKKYSDKENQPLIRIIADHLKAATFLVIEGVRPANKLHGYILRRLIRRAAVKMHQLNGGLTSGSLGSICQRVLDIYEGEYGINRNLQRDEVVKVVDEEMIKFGKSLDKGLKEVMKIEKIDGKLAFDLYQTFGFPYEVTEELFKQKGQQINHQQFEEEFRKHQELSRTASAGQFKGGLAGHSEIETKYHTATHLLHQALRDILGPEVFQKGSNINQERLRFDFSYDKKMTEEEIRKTEELVNQKIKEDLKVERKFMSVPEAQKMNAIGLFTGKYDETVSIYCIGPNYILDPEAKDQRDRGGYYSAEFCGGPHVEHTVVIGGIKITKEEAVSAGVRRIYAQLIS